jgi:hypothetical protein
MHVRQSSVPRERAGISSMISASVKRPNALGHPRRRRTSSPTTFASVMRRHESM